MCDDGKAFINDFNITVVEVKDEVGGNGDMEKEYVFNAAEETSDQSVIQIIETGCNVPVIQLIEMTTEQFCQIEHVETHEDRKRRLHRERQQRYRLRQKIMERNLIQGLDFESYHDRKRRLGRERQQRYRWRKKIISENLIPVTDFVSHEDRKEQLNCERQQKYKWRKKGLPANHNEGIEFESHEQRKRRLNRERQQKYRQGKKFMAQQLIPDVQFESYTSPY